MLSNLLTRYLPTGIKETFSQYSQVHNTFQHFHNNSKMSHPHSVYINNRCRYQSITQQYLKRCLIKDDNEYMFRPIAAIIRFSSKSMVVVLYRIGMFMSRWWDLNICGVCCMLLLRDTGGGVGGICDVRYPGVYSSSMSARCCPMWVCRCCLSISDVYCLWAFAVGCVCSLESWMIPTPIVYIHTTGKAHFRNI